MKQNTKFKYSDAVSYSDDAQGLKCHTVDIWQSELPVGQEASSEYWVMYAPNCLCCDCYERILIYG